MILAKLRLDEEDTLTLNDEGIWESKNRRSLAKLLNLQRSTSPKKSYGEWAGGWFAHCVETAQEVAEKYHAKLELAPNIPEDLEPDDGFDDDPDAVLLDDDENDDPPGTIS